MKIAILDALTLGGCDLESLSKWGELTLYPTTSKEERLAHSQEQTILITNKVVLDEEILSQLPDLKLICISATGMNNVDLAYAKKRGIAVKNVAGYSTSGVAQHTLLLVLALLGKLPYYHQYTQKGAWMESPIFTHLDEEMHELEGKKWGIIGMGAIGQRVAKLATAFGAIPSYHSTSGANTHQPYPALTLEAILEESDILTIHAPLNEKTRHLLNESRLKRVKKGAILINVGRGGIVDEEALSRLMLERNLWVGLDVLESEPMQKNHPLQNPALKERLIITPHIAWGYKESRERLIKGVEQNIQEALREGLL